MRQIVTVVVALIVIVGAALFIVSWSGDGDDTATDDADTSDETDDDEAADDPATDATDDDEATTTTTTAPPAPCTSGTGTPGGDNDPSATETVEEAASDDPATDDPATDDTAAEGETDESEDAPSGPTLGPNSSVSTVGLDTVPFGLTVVQAERAAGTVMNPCDPVGDCYRVAPAEAPEGIVFVVDEGTIERVDIVDGPITTRSGVGIGTEESRVVELFGDSLEREVNDDSSIDLIFVPSSETDADFRVVFTIRDGEVETFRSGRVPLVLEDRACA